MTISKTTKTLIAFVAIFLLIVGTLWGIHWWLHRNDKPAILAKPAVSVVNQPVVAATAPAAAPITKQYVKTDTGTVKVYAPEAKKKLHTTHETQENPAAAVTAATDLKADDHPQEVVSVIDQHTGESHLEVTKLPLPIIAFDQHTDVMASIGVRLAPGDVEVPVGEIEVRHEMMQLKALHLGVVGRVSTPFYNIGKTEGYAGFYASMKF